MAQSQELKQIKKKYGERFMKMCRTHFPTILEEEGKLLEILQANFSDTAATLYDDIQSHNLVNKFASYIFEKFETEKKGRVITEKTPYELLDEAGYELVECHSEREIQSFKKYYADGEELCTFNGDRLDDCVVFWAVKKNVGEIRRKDFESPERDDEYGTSVMSIQFSKRGSCRVSIKNRYNHTVDNPDATLGNDLERIAPGLTYSFEEVLRARGLELDSSKEEFRIPGYIKANDGKLYKYNAHIGDKYYCPENIIIENGEPIQLEGQEKQVLIDCFVVDMEQKTIRAFDDSVQDSFTDSLTNIQKIEMVKDTDAGDGSKKIIIYKEGQEEPIVITVDKDEGIIGYQNSELVEVGDNFLAHSLRVRTLDTPNIEKIGDNFCEESSLEEINFKKLKSIGDNCCRYDRHLKKVNTPELVEAGNGCFSAAEQLMEFNATNLEKVGDDFCSWASLEVADFPNMISIGKEFCSECEPLKIANIPKLVEAPDKCLSNTSLEELNAPNLVKIGNRCFTYSNLSVVDLPQAKEVGDNFCIRSYHTTQINLPEVERVGRGFCTGAYKMTSVNMPNLEVADEGFLEEAEGITEFNVPKISKLRWFFSPNRHMVSKINGIKKNQRLKGKDIVDLDEQSQLLPQEVKDACDIVEQPEMPSVGNKEVDDYGVK